MEQHKSWFLQFIIFLFIAASAFTCRDYKQADEVVNNNIVRNDCQGIIDNQEGSLLSDPFNFEEVDVENSCMKIKISYGGGCKDVKFQLYQTSGIMESFPPQINLSLILEDDDHCKALVYKDLYFDLQSLELPYNTGTIKFNLDGYDEAIVYNY